MAQASGSFTDVSFFANMKGFTLMNLIAHKVIFYYYTKNVWIFSNNTKVMLLVLYYACEELNNSLKFMFIWYDMAYLSDNGVKFVLFFVSYDTAYLNDYSIKFVCFYGMIWHTLVIMAQKFVFSWYKMAYLNDNSANLCWYGMIWHIIMIIAQHLCFMVWYSIP